MFNKTVITEKTDDGTRTTTTIVFNPAFIGIALAVGTLAAVSGYLW